jgi:uncharacterized protein (DUF1697 family)
MGMFKWLGKFYFQPLSKNPLLGASFATLQKLQGSNAFWSQRKDNRRKETNQFMYDPLACEHVSLDFHQCATKERIWNFQNHVVASHFKVRGEA